MIIPTRRRNDMYTYIAGKEPYFSFDVTEENMEAMEAVEEFSLEDGPQLLCIYGEKENYITDPYNS
jgi:hypothetical protein